MTRDEALKALAKAIKEGNVVLSDHVINDKLAPLGIFTADIGDAIESADDTEWQHDEVWSFFGGTVDGTTLVVVVDFWPNGTAFVVTAHFPPGVTAND